MHKGRTIQLRLVQEDDAAFITALRSDEKYNTHLALLCKSMELNQEATVRSAAPINRRSVMPKPRYKTTNWKQYNQPWFSDLLD